MRPASSRTPSLGGILLGHETYSLVQRDLAAEELAPISVKGFSAPVRIYRVICDPDVGEAESDILRYHRPGARIDVDLARLDAAERLEMEAVVGELAERLSRKAN